MVRAIFVPMLAVAVVFVGSVRADEAKKTDQQGNQRIQGTITKVDAQNHSISLKCCDKAGSGKEKTLMLEKDVKILDAHGKEAKIDSLKTGDDICVAEHDDKVTEVRKHAQATITKVDTKGGTITVKMADKDGKMTERTFRLVEDAEYVDSNGRVAVLDVFQSGDDVLFVEANGNIKAMKKADEQHSTAAKQAEKSKK